MFGKFDAEPRNGAKFVEVGLGKVPLFACKTVNFGTKGKSIKACVRKPVETYACSISPQNHEFIMVTIHVLHFVRVFHRSRFGEVVKIMKRLAQEPASFSGTPAGGHASASMKVHKNGTKSLAEDLSEMGCSYTPSSTNTKHMPS
jgi:hypothetical protein